MVWENVDVRLLPQGFRETPFILAFWFSNYAGHGRADRKTLERMGAGSGHDPGQTQTRIHISLYEHHATLCATALKPIHLSTSCIDDSRQMVQNSVR